MNCARCCAAAASCSAAVAGLAARPAAAARSRCSCAWVCKVAAWVRMVQPPCGTEVGVEGRPTGRLVPGRPDRVCHLDSINVYLQGARGVVTCARRAGASANSRATSVCLSRLAQSMGMSPACNHMYPPCNHMHPPCNHMCSSVYPHPVPEPQGDAPASAKSIQAVYPPCYGTVLTPSLSRRSAPALMSSSVTAGWPPMAAQCSADTRSCLSCAAADTQAHQHTQGDCGRPTTTTPYSRPHRCATRN